MLKLLILLISLLSINQIQANLNSKEKLSIEISSGTTKIATFAISSNNKRIAQQITDQLEICKRFKNVSNPTALQNMKQSGIDMFIKATLIEGKIEIEIYDILQSKNIRAFSIQTKGEITQPQLNEITNEIYKTWTNEPGIFNTSIIFATVISKEVYTLEQQEYTKTQSHRVSPPVSYLSSINEHENLILFTKFCSTSRGYSIFSYNPYAKQFKRMLAIASGTVFAPFIHQGNLYVSASAHSTTGLYKISNPFISKTFNNFRAFEQSPSIKTILKVPSRIATSITMFENLAAYCTNIKGKAAIFTAKISNDGMLMEAQQVSSQEGAYYEPVLFENQKIAAVKTHNGNFYLVLIDLSTKTEKTLFTNYYIGKPSFSPCGNWIAVSTRAQNAQDQILLIHKSGKYHRLLNCPLSAKYPIWIKTK